jgi:hypothetical protein
MIYAIFLLTYAGVAIGRVPRLALDRTGIALLGALAMVLAGGIRPDEAWASIHIPTLLLLYGLMVISAQLRLGGFYTWLALRVTRWIERPAFFLASLMLVSGLLAAVLANDIICLAFTPVLGIAQSDGNACRAAGVHGGSRLAANESVPAFHCRDGTEQCGEQCPGDGIVESASAGRAAGDLVYAFASDDICRKSPDNWQHGQFDCDRAGEYSGYPYYVPGLCQDGRVGDGCESRHFAGMDLAANIRAAFSARQLDFV